MSKLTKIPAFEVFEVLQEIPKNLVLAVTYRLDIIFCIILRELTIFETMLTLH